MFSALLALGASLILTAQTTGLTSERLYADLVADVSRWPAWTHDAWEVAGEAGIVVLAGLFALAAVRATRAGSATRLMVIVLGGAVVVAYGMSELLKLYAVQERPCATLAIETIASCPSAGDWSLPSNHATIAAALVMAITALVSRWAIFAVPVAVVVATARIAVGVHYPHDVVTGMALGAVVVTAVALAVHKTRIVVRS